MLDLLARFGGERGLEDAFAVNRSGLEPEVRAELDGLRGGKIWERDHTVRQYMALLARLLAEPFDPEKEHAEKMDAALRKE
jgi:hypothetical protein